MKRTYKNNIFAKRPVDFLIDSMNQTGVDKFWQSSAMAWIRLAMSGNRHFVQNVRSVTVIAHKLKYCQKLTAIVEVNLPDIDQVVVKQLTYTFNQRKHSAVLQ